MRASRFAKSFFSFCFALLLFGCASTQLNLNTLDLASSTDSLLTLQVVHNLANYVENPVALPAQLTISSGTATVSNTVTPSITDPLSQTIATTNTLARTAAATASTTATSMRVATTTGAGAMLSASDVAAQNWAFSTVTDPYQLRRLDALYRYAVNWSDWGAAGSKAFVQQYPLVLQNVTHQMSDCIYGKNTKTGQTDTPVLSNTGPTLHDGQQELVFCVTQAVQSGNYTHSGSTRSYVTQIENRRYLTGPGCIVCYYATGKHISRNLEGTWLHWKDWSGRPVAANRLARPGDIYIGRSGHIELYVDARQPWKFVEFTIAVLSASTIADQSISGSATSGGAGGGQGQAPKATQPFEFTIPLTGG